MIRIKTIHVKNKDLITSPIRSLVRNGEKNADKIKILADRYYGEHDLSRFSFVIEAVSAAGTLSLQSLDPVLEESGGISVVWTVTSDFTAISGRLKVTLRAVSKDGSVCIIFNGGEIEVVGEKNDDYLPAGAGDQLLSQLEAALAAALEEALGRIKAAVDSEVDKALSGFDPEQLIEDALPQNLVVSDDVRRLTVMTTDDFSSLPTPDNQTLYVLI